MDFGVAHEIISPWEKEPIPDDALLYMRVHKSYLDSDGEPIPGAFRNQPTRADGMSTDWNKHSTPRECQARARTPEVNAIIILPVAEVRKIADQIVEHTPIHEPLSGPPILNRAHTDVFGEKSTEARFHFMKIYSFAIRLEKQS
jgi:hypothetical protein